MGLLDAIVLGIVQGLTEFLPVSSSGHLALLHWLTGWTAAAGTDLTFDVALHAGTLAALIVYFARDWVRLLQRWREKMLWLVLSACVPGAVFGVVLEKMAETAFRAPLRIALLLAAMGVVLAAAERWGKKTRGLQDMSWADALGIGLAQALAIMPGVSRAGATMTAGLFLGLSREASARFSFLLSMPIIAGAALWEGRQLLEGSTRIEITPLVVGMLAAGVSGLACIHFLLRFLQRHTFYGFAVYRILVAVAVVAVVLSGLRPPM